MAKSKQINWESGFYQSTESCIIQYSGQEIVINSRITGRHDTIDYTAAYTIRTTPEWKTTAFEIRYTLNAAPHHVEARHENGQWIVNGVVREEFNNCIDIDITVTPFTNALPINRIDLQLNKPQQIEVLYVNVLENSIYPVRQQYTKKSGTRYNFQNVPNDFEADIIVDSEGFVVHYPELFERASTGSP